MTSSRRSISATSRPHRSPKPLPAPDKGLGPGVDPVGRARKLFRRPCHVPPYRHSASGSAPRCRRRSSARCSPASRRSRAGRSGASAVMLADGIVGHPEIPPVHHRLQHRAQPHVGIGDPVERLAVQRAGHGGGAVEGPVAQRCSLGRPARASKSSSPRSAGPPIPAARRTPADPSRPRRPVRGKPRR